MSLAPETATNPLAQAPPDRPTLTLEEWGRQGFALMFGDRVFDQNEMRFMHDWLQEFKARAAAAGGVGLGATPSPQPPGSQAAMSPGQMNANTQDYGTVDGAVPTGENQ